MYPLGPTHENVKGPGVPATDIFISPLKGAAQLLFGMVLSSVIVIGGVLSPTVSVYILEQPRV